MAGGTQVGAVSETLFLPLYALALASQCPDPIISDPGAVALTRELNRSFAGSDLRLHRKLLAGDLPATLVTTMALRVRRYDRYVTDFLAREPDGIVVNLGCGLDDRRRRTDNGRVRWFDLDLPEVIALRRAHLRESDRMRFLASSVLDLDWLDALPDEPGTRFLFVAEGLFMYLPPEGVRALVVALCERFPGAELVAEVAHSRVVRLMRGRLGRGKFRRQFGISGDVSYQFGLQDSHDMQAWAPGLVLLDDWAYFDEDEPRLGWMRPFARWPLFRQAQWTVHYRLGTAAE
jgi:O-methyltransferase involved in polyketide biosynthesis